MQGRAAPGEGDDVPAGAAGLGHLLLLLPVLHLLVQGVGAQVAQVQLPLAEAQLLLAQPRDLRSAWSIVHHVVLVEELSKDRAAILQKPPTLRQSRSSTVQVSAEPMR